ncbi:MAG TPA: FAD:protein FMN transferase [Verrucomicrobiota bacterium]|nr:FAD:protein FMN transferase [Verrucomicrobiota bacterium]
MNVVSLARHAMATRFEIVLYGDNVVALRAAGEEAMDEICRLENQLSLYRATSEIAQLNARAAREPVRVTPELFSLLQHAAKLSAETEGAFDITVAPLVRCWGFMGGNSAPRQRMNGPTPDLSWEGSGVGWSATDGRVPTDEDLAAARDVVGMRLVELSERECSVRFARPGVMLDLGAIGKGYAVERAATVLLEAGVTSALLHGGTSTLRAIGAPPDAKGWKIAVNLPVAPERRSPTRLDTDQKHAGSETGAPVVFELRNESLSVSAVWGRSFESRGETFGHVIDPRTGRPVSGAVLAAVVLPSATETDALSTALMVSGYAGGRVLSELRPQVKTLLVMTDGERLGIERRGFPPA